MLQTDNVKQYQHILPNYCPRVNVFKSRKHFEAQDLRQDEQIRSRTEAEGLIARRESGNSGRSKLEEHELRQPVRQVRDLRQKAEVKSKN